MQRCPGQDMRYWTPDDIFYVCCPYCDHEIEFWKDEPFRLCRSCQKEVRNPRIDLGCAKWCKFGDQCLGRSVSEQFGAEPVIEKLNALVQPLAENEPERYELLLETVRIANLLLTAEGGDLCRVKTAAMLIVPVQTEADPAVATRQMLQQTILDEEETDAICLLIEQVLSDDAPASIDVSVVRDALILADPARQSDADLRAITTEGAQMIFKLRQSKKA